MPSAPPQRIDLALAEGNPLVLSALSEVFEKDARFSLVATSSTAEGFLGAVMRVPVLVGIIDWTIPQLGGQKLAEVLRDQEGAPRLVIYAEDPTGSVTLKAMAAGAAGFVDRKSPVERLLETCLDVAAGKMVFPFVDVRGLQSDPIHQLTRREKALLEALANGLTNKELGRDFDISTNTVKYHLSNLFEKLGVTSRTQAIAYYFKSR
ncbi:MAG TPA: response regulator transcription factor [Albidovulum sp.]|uniref:LuxR C-terminal-related transcriptional regulator n=1 Tax=Albidovulum sp. TaxID=1872424 RepID=UPI002C18ED9F|nr:response regulator transcription factor [Albidovulum sp.]